MPLPIRLFTTEEHMAAHTLRGLFIDELRDTYDAELRLAKAVPALIKAASSEELIAALRSHLAETMEHVDRLESVFDMFDTAPARKTCKAMVGLLGEAEMLIREAGPAGLRDMALIAAAQKIEHYEMATYGCLRTWAGILGRTQVQEFLKQTLDEEGAADRILTDVARSLEMHAAEGEEAWLHRARAY